MLGVPYVSVMLQAPEMAITAFTATHPGAVIDAFFGVPASEQDGRLRGAFMASTVSGADKVALLERLRATYERVDVVADDPAASEMLCTFVGPAISASHRITEALHPLDGRFDKPWVHVVGTTMEIRLVPLMDPDLLVLESVVRTRLSGLAVAAEVSVKHLDFAGYEKWKRVLAAHADS